MNSSPTESVVHPREATVFSKNSHDFYFNDVFFSEWEMIFSLSHIRSDNIIIRPINCDDAEAVAGSTETFRVGFIGIFNCYSITIRIFFELL